MTKTIKIIIGVIIAIIIIGGIWYWTNQKPTEAETIKIGFTGPLSGNLAAWGDKQRKGIDLAVEEVNKSGGVSGRIIEIVYEDSQCRPNAAALNIGKLALQGVQVIIGDTCSSATLAAAPIAENNKIVLITPISGADSISQSGDYIFRNFIPNRYYSIAAAEKISEMGIKKVAVMYINNDAGISWKDAFNQSFKSEITNVEGYNSEETDFKTILTKIKKADPDLIFLAGYSPDGALILKQAKELGLTQQFFGAADAFDDPVFLEVAGSVAEGFIFQSVPMGLDDKIIEFKEKFEAHYKEEPSLFATYAYDTAMVVMEAIKNCGSSSNQIKECLYNTDYQGVTNHITFDENGDLIGGNKIMKQVKNGEFVPYEE